MAKHEVLKVEKRTVLGKKVKKLRKEGLIPANIYGKDIKSQAVETNQKDFEKVWRAAGETGLVDIHLGTDVIPVLIHNLQADYHNNILHADFYKVNLKEKIKTDVPIEFVGEPKAVTDKIGLLMPIMSVIEVEALPEELPENIQVNVENLILVDDQITVADLKAPEGVEILTDPGQVVVKIGALISKEAEEQAAADEAAAEAAAAETAEGEAPVEGETPAEGAAASAESSHSTSSGQAGEPKEVKAEEKSTE